MSEPQSSPPPTPPPPNIDLEELARLIYEILRRELLLENERTGR